MARRPEDLFADPLLQVAPSFKGFKVPDQAGLSAIRFDDDPTDVDNIVGSRLSRTLQ